MGPNILQFLTHVWVQPEDLDSLLDHYVRERWGVPTIETFVPDPRPNPQSKVPGYESIDNTSPSLMGTINTMHHHDTPPSSSSSATITLFSFF